MKNRKSLYLILTTLLITFVIVSYALAQYISNNNLRLKTSGTMPYLKLTSKSSDSMQTSLTNNVAKVAQGTKFIFKIKYIDKEVRNMVLEKYYNGSTRLNSRTEVQLNELFKNQGYNVSKMSNHEVIFLNNSAKRYSYSGNRYFLGLYNNDLVTIYKTDKNGDIVAHKVFNSNVYAEDGKQRPYNFESVDSGKLEYKNIDELKEKKLIEDLIRGTKSTKDIGSSKALEVDQESGEFKTPEKAFDYARSLLES